MKIRKYLKEHFQDIKGMYTYGGGETSVKGSKVKIPDPITQKLGISNLRVGMDAIQQWRNPEAIKEAINIMNYWGTPNILTHNKAVWFKIGGFDRVMVKDEAVAHNEPKFHLDYLHCTKQTPVPPEYQNQLAAFMPNLIFDGLKKEVTVRCNDMVANAVSLGFVDAVIKGEVEATYDEFMNRQANRLMPEWFELPNVEWVTWERLNWQYKDWLEKMERSGGKYGRGYHQTLGYSPEDMEVDLNIKEAKGFEEIPKGESPDIDWKKLENPEDQKYLNQVLKKALKQKDEITLKKLKNFHKSGKIDVNWKKLENPRDQEYLNSILKEEKKTPFKAGDIKKATKFYAKMYPEFNEQSIEKGLKAAWKKHKALDPVTVNYFLSGKNFGGLGFGKEK